MDSDVLAKIKRIIREDLVECFTDEQIENYYEDNDEDVNAAIYNLLVVKAEDTELNVSGLQTKSSASYFLRIASRYRPNNSGTMGGG